MQIVSLNEVAVNYPELAQLAVIFNHDVTMDRSTLRWKKNGLMDRMSREPGIAFHTPAEWRGSSLNTVHEGAVDLNWLAAMALTGEVKLEEYMKFYMQIGYSLAGYEEVFGQREVTDYQLAYLSPPPRRFNFDEAIYQTPIEYMRLKYAGQVLKL